MAENKKKLPISVFELVMYIICAVFGLWGVTFISLGIAVNFVHYKSGLVEGNKVLADALGGLGFLNLGIIVLVVAVIVAAIVLLVNAKVADRVYEKEQRRKAARFNRKAAFSAEQETVVEATSTPVEE